MTRDDILRLGEITELTHKDERRWLPTQENVVDDATRLAQTLISENDRWFQGPRFMLEAAGHEVLHTAETKDTWLPDPVRFSVLIVQLPEYWHLWTCAEARLHGWSMNTSNELKRNFYCKLSERALNPSSRKSHRIAL